MSVRNEVRYSAPDSPFQLPPELMELKSLVREIVESECLPLEAEFLEAQRAGREVEPGRRHPYQGPLSNATWERLTRISKDAGIYDIHLPTAYGGSGLGVLGRFVVEEEINRSLVTLPTARVPGILFGCTPEQEQEYLLPTIEGTKFSAFAQTEPGAGSDPGNSMATKAVLEGDEWVINGTKTFISYAHRADYLLLQAVTDESLRQRGGITMFIVDTDTPGISMTPVHKWFPGPDEQWTIHLDDVRVPSRKVLGEVGGGFRLGQQWLAVQDRLTRGSLACGILSRSLDLATAWAAERTTFGKPLADRQAIQWMLVDVMVDLQAIRAISYQCAAAADRGEDVRVAAAMAKLVGGNWGHRSIDKIMQVFGGTGESLDMPISHWYRELRHGRIGGGTDEMQRMLIARGLFAGDPELWRA
jgi:acyl-CoA dehydrogenase